MNDPATVLKQMDEEGAAYRTHMIETKFEVPTLATIPSTNAAHLAWIDDPLTATQHGIATKEELMTAFIAWRDFMFVIRAEWTPARLKEWLLQHKRDLYAAAARSLQAVELENKDARIKGVSFKERTTTFTAKADKLRRIAHGIKQDGLAVKKATFDIETYVQPEDMPAILEGGMEKHLKYALFGYPHQGLAPLALSPVKV